MLIIIEHNGQKITIDTDQVTRVTKEEPCAIDNDTATMIQGIVRGMFSEAEGVA